MSIQEFYAVGSGTSINGTHVQGSALDGSKYDGCDGSYIFDDVAAGTSGYATANIEFSCNGSGQQEVDITFVMNSKPIPSGILVRKDGNSPWMALCSPTNDLRDACS